ncbi:MAG: succinate dehydrogenase [Chloroflexi bacterium]|nr:succinate dehydrogenase [Chloroflexota bacterium]
MTTYSGITRRKVQVQSNFERFAFLFMRLSGVALLLLAVGHMMIQHVVNDVHDLDVAFVVQQWSSWTQRIIDMLLLFFALSHGINGLRNVLEDYVHGASAVKALNTVMAIFWIVSLIVAGYAIASFPM